MEREAEKAKKEVIKLAKKGKHVRECNFQGPAKIVAKDIARANKQIEQTYMIQS